MQRQASRKLLQPNFPRNMTVATKGSFLVPYEGIRTSGGSCTAYEFARYSIRGRHLLFSLQSCLTSVRCTTLRALHLRCRRSYSMSLPKCHLSSGNLDFRPKDDALHKSSNHTTNVSILYIYIYICNRYTMYRYALLHHSMYTRTNTYVYVYMYVHVYTHI